MLLAPKDSYFETTTSAFFIDSHCHFDFSDFDGEREKVWQESLRRGVVAMVMPGVAVEQWARAKKISKKFNAIYFSAGIHPWWIAQLCKSSDELEALLPQLREKHIKMLKSKKCIAVGECGLDKMIKVPAECQYEVFDYQVQLAAEYNKPLIVHSRKAHNEVMHHIDRVSLSRGGVIHAFSGSEALAKQYIDRGFYIGVGGTITYDRAKKTRDAIKSIPLSSIVLETDAPDMPLQGKQGQRNSSEFLPDIAQAIAEIKGETIDVVAQKTTENSCRLFGLDPAGFAA